MQHYSTTQQNPIAVAGLDSVLVPDRPAPAPTVPAVYLAPALPAPLPAYVPSEAATAASDGTSSSPRRRGGRCTWSTSRT